MSFVRPDGTTKKQLNEKLKKQMEQMTPSARLAASKQIQDDIPPRINSYAQWLINRFWEVSSGRGVGQNGPLPLTFNDILSYCEVVGEDLEPREAQALKTLDQAYLNSVFEEKSKAQEGQ
jgi:hypothetical protein